MRLWLVTTFPNAAWDVYAQVCLQSLVDYLPDTVKLCVGLDDAQLENPVRALLSPQHELWVGRNGDHQGFIAQFQNRDHASEYRLQAARFCHKIFVLKKIMDKAAALPEDTRPTYIIWWDADARLTRAVTQIELEALMPTGQEAVSYLGRKDWDHSECGFMGFNMAHEGKEIIDWMHMYYVQGLVFSLPQWHDSYLFDVARKTHRGKNLSEGVPGNNVWAATALGVFSEHWKGQAAKQQRRSSTDAELFKA
ncbi:MAG: hypothetical protein EB059_03655 [Alphaproteobacteria bacterium]|nr:hypothetical protein [Alphaproteobacteria bacterium]